MADVLNLIERIAGLIQKGSRLDAEEQIAELRTAVVTLSEDNQTLREELRRVRAERSNKEARRYDSEQEVYFIDGEQGAFCQPCWDKDNAIIPLARADRSGYPWRCNVCKSVFGPRIQKTPPDFPSAL